VSELLGGKAQNDPHIPMTTKFREKRGQKHVKNIHSFGYTLIAICAGFGQNGAIAVNKVGDSEELQQPTHFQKGCSMSKTRKQPLQLDTPPVPMKSNSPVSSLVFISHDSRDAALAEAFSRLLNSVSCGVLKSFRSSDHRTIQGIEYGVEWYPAIINKLTEACDVVALLTQRSFERPWILFECGIARGKLDESGRRETKIRGLALGIPLSRVVGPFAQFQNCPFEIPAITKMVIELVSKIPNSEPDREAIEMQVKAFSEKATKLLKVVNNGPTEDEQTPVDATSVAKLFEEVKVMFQDLPPRMEARISDAVRPFGNRKWRHFHPRMLEEIMHMGGCESDDPIGILFAASMVRDEMPWFYEIALETYRALNSGDTQETERQIKRLHWLREMVIHGPLMENFCSKDMHMFMMEYPHMIEHMAHRCLENKKSTRPRKNPKIDVET
jgi:hypothetical protein